MTIPPRFLAELRDRLTLSEIVGRRVRLARAGREFKGCCPFHQEKSPSFYVNDDKQFYHCFGCGAHGDAVGFLMQHDNLSFPEAVEALAPLAGMEVPKSSPQEAAQARAQKDLHTLMEAAAKFFEAELRKRGGAGSLEYLTGRGLSLETIAAFRIGFAPGDGQSLRAHLKASGYTDAQMIECAILKKSERGTEPYSFFRERIMFPVADRRGRIVAFGGRILPEALSPSGRGLGEGNKNVAAQAASHNKSFDAADAAASSLPSSLPSPRRGEGEGWKPPKYINSSETPLFHKGRMLYGESHARTAAANGESVVVVEGYMDVIACHQAGVKGAVAPMGTALTDEQITALWQMTEQPLLCFDGDEAGRRAASRASARILPLLKPGRSAGIVFLPDGEDPDSLVRRSGPTALTGLLGAPLPLVDFLWDSAIAGKRLQTPEERAALEAEVMGVAESIADRGVQNFYRQAFKDRLYHAFRPQKTVIGSRGKGPVKPSTVVPIMRPVGDALAVAKLALLAGILNYPEIFDTVEEDLAGLEFTESRLEGLRNAVVGALSTDHALDAKGLADHLFAGGWAEEMALAQAEAVYRRVRGVRPGLEREQVLREWENVQGDIARRIDTAERQAGMRTSLSLHGIRDASEDV